MKKGLLLLTCLVLLVAGGALTYRYLRSHGFSARVEPHPIEEAFALTVRKLVTPRKFLEMKNPLPASPVYIAEARNHYADHCAVCHDVDGSGETKVSKGLYPPAPDLASKRTQELSDGEIFYIIREGIRFSGMPGFGGEDKENWKLVQFIRHIPKLSSEELEMIKAAMPRAGKD
ncbi:MAG: c-type cytochrome [Bdellovibrionales bacterium]|nr:c-type cytochrome [Bdellovibrionales bacterium]